MRYFSKIILAVLIPASLFGSRTFTTSTDTLVVTSPGTSLPLTGTVSIAVFPTTSQSDGAYHYYFQVEPGGSLNSLVLRKTSANTLCLLITNGSGTTFNVCAGAGAYTLPTSQWSVITANWTNGGDMFIFLNGIIVASSSASGVGALSWTGTGTQAWSIGNASIGTVDMRGSASLVGLWSRALTQQEVIGLALLFAPSQVSTSGLISNWTLAGSSLLDSSSSHNLTATGTTVGSDPTPINLGGSTTVTPWTGFQ